MIARATGRALRSRVMREVRISESELVDVWRDAARAAELAERLANEATEAARDAEAKVGALSEIARLAGEVAASALRAAQRAQVPVTEATARRKGKRPDAAA